jgi:hypothetical protein
MARKKSRTLSQAIEQVLARVQAPTSIDEVAERVLALSPSQAKNPMTFVRGALRREHAGHTLVLLDRKTVVPLRVAMQGVRFRARLSPEAATAGALPTSLLYYFRPHGLGPADLQFVDPDGEPLTAQVKLMTWDDTDEWLRAFMYERTVVEFSDWFRTQGVQGEDSLLITIDDWQRGRFRLQHEPLSQRRDAEIQQQNRELAEVLFDMLETGPSEQLFLSTSIPTAYARLSHARGYPGDHWQEVVDGDDRLDYTSFSLVYGDSAASFKGLMLDLMDERPQQSDIPQPRPQDRHVYRFKATLSHRPTLWRRLELQGHQTLSDFDAILRRAFHHDSSDHLGGFWKHVRRGTTKRFREVDLGTVDPFGDGEGAEDAIAEFGLKPGDELKYVYDFGDWIEHRLTLEEIGEPEAKATYPRVIEQNKPKYQYCQSCKANARETVATWVCYDCTTGRGQVLICETCLTEAHEDHYVDEVIY